MTTENLERGGKEMYLIAKEYVKKLCDNEHRRLEESIMNLKIIWLM